MDIHEYQAKELLAKFGVPVPRGGLAYSPEQAAYRAREIGGDALGGQGADPLRRPRQGRRRQAMPQRPRDRGGGRRDCSARKLVTEQTGPRGKLVSRLYVEAAARWQRELYLGFVLDREDRARHRRGLLGRRHGDRGDRARNSPRP